MILKTRFPHLISLPQLMAASLQSRHRRSQSPVSSPSNTSEGGSPHPDYDAIERQRKGALFCTICVLIFTGCGFVFTLRSPRAVERPTASVSSGAFVDTLVSVVYDRVALKVLDGDNNVSHVAEKSLAAPPALYSSLPSGGRGSTNDRLFHSAERDVVSKSPPPHSLALVVPQLNSSACPKTTTRDGSCIHANNKLGCVPLRADNGGALSRNDNSNVSSSTTCQRPCGAFVLKMRGAGGVLLREGLLMSIYGGAGFGKGLDESFIVSEGWALETPLVNLKVAKFSARNAVFMTSLKHPINRILGRYWYEGRWEMGKKSPTLATARSLEDWMGNVLSMEKRARPPARLWSCVSNFYVKMLAAWQGESLCNTTTTTNEEGCVEGVGPMQLAKAKKVLSSQFHVALIAEWLNTDAQIEWLGQVFCFPTVPRVTRLHKKFGKVPFPLMKRKAAPGGHSALRPNGWLPDPATLHELHRLNSLDLELFAWVEMRARKAIEIVNKSRGGTFPPLPNPALSP